MISTSIYPEKYIVGKGENADNQLLDPKSTLSLLMKT